MPNKENDILLHRFKASKYNNLGELVRKVKSELTAETYAAVMLRHKPPAIRTLLIMAADLELPKEELIQMLIARGEHTIANLIDPRPITKDEQTLLDKFRSISNDPARVKLVIDLLDTIA